MQSKLVGLPRPFKKCLLVAADLVIIPLSFWLALNLRLDFTVGLLSESQLLALGLGTILSAVAFAYLGMYRAMVRHLGIEAAWVLAQAAAVSAALLAISMYSVGAFLPRSVPLIYFFLLLVTVGAMRFSVRHWLYQATSKKRRRVAIYGAGSAGAQVLSALSSSRDYKPVLFVDDDLTLAGRTIGGVPIVGPERLAEKIGSLNIVDLLLAIPSASAQRRKEVLEAISPLPVYVRTIPGISDLVSGKAHIEEFKEVDVEDLLGRDPVAPDENLLLANIQGKAVMVTGAGGSIGSELCRQIIRLQPKTLILFERCEFALYKILHELESEFPTLGDDILPILGSVLDESKIESTILSLNVDTIYHAAAYKHVPLVEYNMVEGIRNNVFGTLKVAEAADRCGVETCVLISTDKAVRPANFMGASKRLAELVLQGIQKKGSKTRFSMVRFGNVLGSSGSVIPLFKRQIAQGGPITVTHPDIIRYFMTIPESAQLVIQAGAMAKGGDVFVLEMGEPVRIDDLARKMIHLMGLRVVDDKGNGDVEITYSGLRPGEKLYEELLIGDNVTSTRHPRILRAVEFCLDWPQLSKLLMKLEMLCEQGRCEDIKDLLQENCPIDFNLRGEVEDILWKHGEDQRSVIDVKVKEKKGELVDIASRQELAS